MFTLCSLNFTFRSEKESDNDLESLLACGDDFALDLSGTKAGKLVVRLCINKCF